MSREELEQTIHDHFDTIMIRALYDPDGSYNLAEQDETAKRMGNLFYDYMVASIFDMSWEGFDDQELEAVGALLGDMATYQKNM